MDVSKHTVTIPMSDYTSLISDSDRIKVITVSLRAHLELLVKSGLNIPGMDLTRIPKSFNRQSVISNNQYDFRRMDILK